jgi:hypothetical protein
MTKFSVEKLDVVTLTSLQEYLFFFFYNNKVNKELISVTLT